MCKYLAIISCFSSKKVLWAVGGGEGCWGAVCLFLYSEAVERKRLGFFGLFCFLTPAGEFST